MHQVKFDETDIKIVSILQKEGRTKRSDLAERVGLSVPSISDRLRKLEDSGVLSGYNAILTPEKIGLEVMAFIFITSESSQYYSTIIERAQEHDEIQECHAITGDGSHLLKIRTRSTSTLEQLLSHIQAWPGVINTRTDIVLSSSKESPALPLDFWQVNKSNK